MNTLFAPLFLLSFLSTVFAQTLTINSLTNVVECQPSLISWIGGTQVAILPAGQPAAAPLLNFGRQDGNSLTWTANFTAGVSGFLQLRDSTGAIGQSAAFTVLASSDTSCINTSAGVGPTPATTAASGTSTGTAAGTTPVSGSTAAGSSAGTTGGITKVSQTTSSTSTGAAQPKSSSAATASQYVPIGTLAMIGTAALAFAL